MDVIACLDQVAALAGEAGRRILAVYDRGGPVVTKPDASPLTAADLAAHRCLSAGLRARYPALPVLSEEGADVPYAVRRRWRRYWLVDPLDGTREFVNRNGEFTVNVALVEDGEPVLGVVFAPVTGVCYAGALGVGAFKQTADGARQPIRVAKRASSPLRVVVSRSHGCEALRDYLAWLHGAAGAVTCRTMGSALKLCRIAEGAADLYPRLGPTCEWDTAAGQAVVSAAGGKVTDLRLQPLRYNTGHSLNNPDFLAFGDRTGPWATVAWR